MQGQEKGRREGKREVDKSEREEARQEKGRREGKRESYVENNTFRCSFHLLRYVLLSKLEGRESRLVKRSTYSLNV